MFQAHTFAHVKLVNLARRPDRLETFWSRFPDFWPFPKPERVEAIDGEICGKPDWFTQQPGAWGCLQTHLAIYLDAMHKGGNLFIFEDDVVWSEDAHARLQPFFDNLPDDWDMIYLGGLHRSPVNHPPRKVNEHVHAGLGITTTYAYGIRASFLPRLYQLLISHSQEETHHIDQMLARLQLAHGIKVYCPVPWIVGMDEGVSDICGRYYRKPHFWEYSRQQVENGEPFHLETLISRVRVTGTTQTEVDLTAKQRRPRYLSSIGGWFSTECGEVYYRVCREQAARNPRRVCRLAEVGVWRGRSLSFLTNMIASGEVEAFAVDTWKGNTDPNDPTHDKDVYADFLLNLDRLKIRDRVNIVRLPSVEASKQFEDESLEVVHIDADHEGSHVAADIRAWWPKLVPGGTMLFHDYSPACACPEVVKAIDDWAAEQDLVVEAQADMAIVRKPALVTSAQLAGSLV